MTCRIQKYLQKVKKVHRNRRNLTFHKAKRRFLEETFQKTVPNLLLQTHFDDSALFYASGESPNHHHIAVSLVNATIAVDADLGGGNVVTRVGEEITDNQWHNLTILHRNNSVAVYLDGNRTELDLPGSHRHLYIDPEIYIGGGPELHSKKGTPTEISE